MLGTAGNPASRRLDYRVTNPEAVSRLLADAEVVVGNDEA